MKQALLLSLILIFGNAGFAADIVEGKAAPAMDLKFLDGSRFVLAEQTGKVVIINFWATWCAPCRAEMPAFEAYYRQHQAEGLQMIAISMDDPKDETKVREVMRAFTFPAAMVRDSSIKGYGRIWRIPLTFVIDRRGSLRRDGWYDDPGINLSMLEKIVTPLLNTPAK